MGYMRLYVSALVVFLFLTGIAFGAVGDAGVSDSYHQQGSQAIGYQPTSPSSQTYASVAPEIGGPYEERMSADDLRLPQPQAESFQPDGDLNFISATPPSVSEETFSYVQGTGQGSGQWAGQGAGQGANQEVSQGAIPGQETGTWYYPGSVTSRNKFKVQTFSGLKTVAGCGFGGYLPLWSDINAAGNFYVYEWYPGQLTPSVRWWGWTWPGTKKGWFTGDVPGWHILSYNCRDWSNYVYIYVWPSGSGDYGSDQGSGYGTIYGTGYSGDYSTGHGGDYGTGYGADYATGTPAVASSGSLPSGAPTPPDPNAESLVLPDFNLLSPPTGQGGYVPGTAGGYSAGTAGMAGTSIYPSQSPISYPVQGTAASFAPNIPQIGYTQGIMPVTSATGSQAQKTCTACADKGSYASFSGHTAPTAPYGPVSQTQTYQMAYQTTYQTVFPKSSTCRCNEYSVSAGQNTLSTVGGVRLGEWVPLWSKVSKPGIYWSFEWMQCGSQPGYYCQPEVRSFGYKNAGWHQTWFRGNKPGWHILSYSSSDWSNYIYIYVWPMS